MKDDLEAMEGPGGSQASLPCLPFGSITPEPEADTFVGRWGLCEGGSASFLEGMGAGIVVGRGGGIYSVTSRALDILGCSCKEAASRSFYDFIDPED
ncbi:MAG: hypothetical protein KKB20_24045, partial [Proteobacteria bacterium]|nr:hypothetical protein [Pseudomonadota bacterium]